MDVQADEAGIRPDPSATAIVERPVTDSQGRLFNDGYPTYADTDKIPAVSRRAPAPGPARWLRILVVLVGDPALIRPGVARRLSALQPRPDHHSTPFACDSGR